MIETIARKNYEKAAKLTDSLTRQRAKLASAGYGDAYHEAINILYWLKSVIDLVQPRAKQK